MLITIRLVVEIKHHWWSTSNILGFWPIVGNVVFRLAREAMLGFIRVHDTDHGRVCAPKRFHIAVGNVVA